MRYSIPPLRLILNTNCNGQCNYCHNEGCGSMEEMENMPKDIIVECAHIAERIMIPCLTLTGGEPTLRKDLADIINEIRNICVNTNINLTSNGYNLHNFCDLIISPIDSLNLSITSFDKSVASHFQSVDPEQALQSFYKFPARHKNINVVIVEENYLEISEIIDFCISKSISLDLMFDIKEFKSENKKIQHHIFNKIESLGDLSIILGSTPIITYRINENSRINLKHPFLSSLTTRGICNNCSIKLNCFEKICAVRVYPNSVVSPCLNQKIISDKGDLNERICYMYSQILSDFSLLSFMNR